MRERGLGRQRSDSKGRRNKRAKSVRDWDRKIQGCGQGCRHMSEGASYGSDAYVRASVRSRRAGTIGLMLKSYQTWGCRR